MQCDYNEFINLSEDILLQKFKNKEIVIKNYKTGIIRRKDKVAGIVLSADKKSKPLPVGFCFEKSENVELFVDDIVLYDE